jgi:hypothetical protein
MGAGTLPASGEPRRPRAEPVKRPLSDRINDRRVVQLTPLADKKAEDAVPAEPVRAAATTLFAVTDQVVARPDHLAVVGDRQASEAVVPAAAASNAPNPPARRPRLLERITNIDKPGSN